MLLGDAVELVGPQQIGWTILLSLAFLCLAAGLTLLPMALRATKQPGVVAGTAIAVIGSVAGASLQALFRARAVLFEAGQSDAVAVLDASAQVTPTTLAPPCSFRLGC